MVYGNFMITPKLPKYKKYKQALIQLNNAYMERTCLEYLFFNSCSGTVKY